ncbi:MAG: sigma-70 family RNA polymerase sigma factor [Clostridia bacterium]|nr:sigma-70 family RNA polymerase sigma factor [Clostridia bacterium]
MQNKLEEFCSKSWEEFEPLVRRVASSRLLGLSDEIDDVVSETFTALCAKVSQDGAPNNTKTWLYGTLNNIINQQLGKKYSDRENVSAVPVDEIELKFTCSIPDPAFKSVTIDEFCEVVRSLLSEDEYKLIEDLYINEIKVSEVAKKLNLTDGAVRQRSYRICSKLRETLSEYSDLTQLL